MKAQKITKEEQETKLKKVIPVNKKVKPPFSQWLRHDKTAFKITFIIGAFGGLLATLILLIGSFIFDFDLFFKILFGLLVVWQGWNTYKILRNQKYISSSINDIAFKGKYDNKKYEVQKQQYNASKNGAPA